MSALLPERAWRVTSLWPAFARQLSLERADRVLHRQPGRPLVGVGDRDESANRVGARLDVELHVAAGPEQPPLRRWAQVRLGLRVAERLVGAGDDRQVHLARRLAELREIGRASPLGPVGHQGCPSVDSEARWIEPPRAITALSRKLAASTPPSTSASLIMNRATASRLVSSRGNPEDVYCVIKCFSHVRYRFGAKAGSRCREVGPDWHPRCSHALRQHRTGHWEGASARQAPQLSHYQEAEPSAGASHSSSKGSTRNARFTHHSQLSFAGDAVCRLLAGQWIS